MNILYGVQTTGNGHLARSHVMISELRRRGHEVTVILSGAAKHDNWLVKELQADRVYKGASLHVKNGKLQHFQTLKQFDLKSLWRDIRDLDVDPYDLIISDFEPITAWAGKLKKKFTLGIANQYALLAKDFLPLKYKFSSHRLVINYFAPVHQALGLHWQPLGNTIPPICGNLSRNTTLIENLIIVYLPWESLTEIKPLLWQCEEYQFHIYDPYSQHTVTEHNVVTIPFSKENFYSDLQQCHGIISNAGFTLITESLLLGKKLLVKPMDGIEQLVNAHFIQKDKMGTAVKKFNIDLVKDWLANKNQSPRLQIPNVPQLIVEWLEMKNWQDTQSLVKECWRQTQIIL